MFKKCCVMVTLAAMLLLLFDCSDVSDKPVRWSHASEVPVTNEKFILIDEFNKIFDNSDTIRFVDPDTLKTGDTIKLVKPATDSFDFETKEDDIDTQTVGTVIGVVPLTSASVIGDTVALPAAAGVFSASLPFTLDKIYSATFYDTATSVLAVNISNISAIELTNISVAISGVDTQVIASIPAGASRTAQLDLRNKSLSHSVSFDVSGTDASGGAKQLGLSFSLNGLIVRSCTVSDSLIQFEKTVNAVFEITDTVAMDYIDLSNGTFQYFVKNETGLELRAGVDHQHLWVQDFCSMKNIENVNGLSVTTSSDSLTYYAGNKILMGGKNILPHSDDLIAQPNIADRRLFTLWNTEKLKSCTNIRFSLATVAPKGDTVTINATDSVKFTIAAVSFRFKEFLGTVMMPYERDGDTQKVAITLPDPLNASVMDSLRGHVVFTDVKGMINAKPSMPERSYIDSMLVSFVAHPRNNGIIKDSTLTVFRNLSNDSTYIRSINITNVTNQFPDTVIINTKVIIPVGTRMRICNDIRESDVFNYDKYIGRMSVKLLTMYQLEPKIDWTVISPATLDLGSSHFEVVDPMRFFRKLENRNILMHMDVKNNSNLNMHIFGLIAPSQLMDTLDSMPTNEFVSLVMTKGNAEKRGFVNFMGDTGVYVPKRQDTARTVSEVKLDNGQLETILSSDSCSWRWIAKLESQPRDALTDTDYIDIRSKLRVEGVNSTDSLIIWE